MLLPYDGQGEAFHAALTLYPCLYVPYHSAQSFTIYKPDNLHILVSPTANNIHLLLIFCKANDLVILLLPYYVWLAFPYNDFCTSHPLHLHPLPSHVLYHRRLSFNPTHEPYPWLLGRARMCLRTCRGPWPRRSMQIRLLQLRRD